MGCVKGRAANGRRISRDDYAEAERIGSVVLRGYPGLTRAARDDCLAFALGEAGRSWDGRAKFSTLVVTIAGHEAVRRRRAEARAASVAARLADATAPTLTEARNPEVLGLSDEVASSDAPPRRPRGAVDKLGHEIHAFIDRHSQHVASILWPRSDPNLLADWLRDAMLGELPESVSRQARIPPDFRARLERYVGRYAQTGDGDWVEAPHRKCQRRKGRPGRAPTTRVADPASWRMEREAVCVAIVRHALSLAGLPSKFINGVDSAQRQRDSREIDAALRKARRSAKPR